MKGAQSKPNWAGKLLDVALRDYGNLESLAN